MIYRFRLLSAENDEFIREIDIDGDQTFLEFSKSILESVDFDASYLSSFFTVNENWEKETEISPFESNIDEDSNVQSYVMDVTMIREIVKEKKQKLVYVFDLISDRVFFIEFIEALKSKKDIKYPSCVYAKGNAPEQISKIDENIDQSLINSISKNYDDLHQDELFDNLEDDSYDDEYG